MNGEQLTFFPIMPGMPVRAHGHTGNVVMADASWIYFRCNVSRCWCEMRYERAMPWRVVTPRPDKDATPRTPCCYEPDAICALCRGRGPVGCCYPKGAVCPQHH